MKTYIGIDSGKKGAIAILSDAGLAVNTMPLIGKPGSKAADLDVFSLLTTFRCTAADCAVHVVIEKPVAMPQRAMGACGSFYRAGVIAGMLSALGIPFTRVAPQTWQKVMLGPFEKDQSGPASILAAQRLFPGKDFRRTPRCRDASDDFTDAALMAEYGRRLGL